jgi:3-oxoadipate enol-lactonase
MTHTRTLTRESATLHYRIIYPREPQHEPRWITLLNGFSRSSRDFLGWGDRLARQGWNVLLPDNRGAGETRSDAGFSLEDMADDTLAIWRHEQISHSVVLGISMGGMIAQRLVARAPEAVRGLILISTCHDPQYVNSPKPPWEAPDHAAALERACRYVSPSFAARHPRMMESLTATMLASAKESGFLRGTAAQRAAVDGFEAREDLRHTRSPALIIHGEHDTIISPEGAKKLGALLPHAEFALLPDTGHMLLIETRELFTRVDQFLARLTSP